MTVPDCWLSLLSHDLNQLTNLSTSINHFNHEGNSLLATHSPFARMPTHVTIIFTTLAREESPGGFFL